MRVIDGLDASGCPTAPTAERVLWRVASRRDSRFEVVVSPGLLTSTRPPERLRRLVEQREVLVVTTPTVEPLYARPLAELVRPHAARLELLSFRCDESTKTTAVLESVCAKA